MQYENELQKTNIKISIIIPMYNCELYIRECVTSVLKQSLSNFEIICVNDGSTDDTASIIHEIAGADNRVKVFNQENQGAGVARNAGIRRAKGEYIAFLDADDYYLDANALEKMYKLCREKNVNVCGSFRKRNENSIEKEEKLFRDKKFQSLPNGIYFYKDVQIDYDYQSFIFNRKFIIDSGIEFPCYKRFQDPPFMVRIMYEAKAFTVAETYLYCYRVPDMYSRFTLDKVKDMIRGILDNLDFAQKNNLSLLFQTTLGRLEYEYKDIILHNLADNDIEIVQLLTKASVIAEKTLGIQNYLVRPLREILSASIQQTNYYEESLISWLKQQNEIAIYGAGKLSNLFFKYLEKYGLHKIVTKIVVTNIEGNTDSVGGIHLVEISEFDSQDVYVLVATGAGYHKEIERKLKVARITKYILLDDVFLSGLS